MTIDDVVNHLFDGLEEFEPYPERFQQKLETAKTELEKLRAKKQWTMEQLDRWCWADSTSAFDYIFGE